MITKKVYISNLFFGMFALSCAVLANAATNQKTYDWTGFYIGGFAGGASGANITTTEPLRVDDNTYWFRPFNDSYSYDTNPSFIGGGTAGYNWQIHGTPYLIGLEMEYGYLNENGSSMDPNQIPYSALTNHTTYNTSSSSINIGGSYGYAFTGGRVGYAQDRFLYYLKSGAVFTDISSQYSSVKTEPTRMAFLNMSGSNNITGYGVGGGIEYALPFEELSNVSVKLEYLYLGIDSTQVTYGHCSCDFLWKTTETISGINTIKLGLNYKF